MQGQQITTPFTPSTNNGNNQTTPIVDDEGTPLGGWKDGLFDCFKFGPFHPSFIYACCCPQVLMAQVMTRMRLDWLGETAPDEERKKTFKTVVYILFVYWIIGGLLPDPVIYEQNGHTIVKSHPFLSMLKNALNLAFGIYTLVALTRTRKAVRERYEIPERHAVGCEDLCCSFWCGCCTVSQLARQTINYETHEARWFTDTGLDPQYPVMVV